MDKALQYAKFWAAFIAAILGTVAQVLPGGIRPWATIIVLVAGAIAVYRVPNADASAAPKGE